MLAALANVETTQPDTSEKLTEWRDAAATYRSGGIAYVTNGRGHRELFNPDRRHRNAVKAALGGRLSGRQWKRHLRASRRRNRRTA